MGIGATSCKNESVSSAAANLKEKPAQRRKYEKQLVWASFDEGLGNHCNTIHNL